MSDYALIKTAQARAYFERLSSILKDISAKNYWDMLSPKLELLPSPKEATLMDCPSYRGEPFYIEFPLHHTPSYKDEPKYAEIFFKEEYPNPEPIKQLYQSYRSRKKRY